MSIVGRRSARAFEKNVACILAATTQENPMTETDQKIAAGATMPVGPRGPTCACGCGKKTKAIYAPGHAMRLRGTIVSVDVDEQDSDLLARRWKGELHSKGKARRLVYAVSYERQNSGAKKIYLHRLIGERILGRALVRSDYVDHVNGNGLNNRRSNLRVDTQSVNMQNRIGLSANNVSGFRGVHWRPDIGKWEAQVKLGGVKRTLGYFIDLVDADRVARQWRIANMPGYVPENS